MVGEFRNGQMNIDLSGRIDSNNAAEVEKEILELLEGKGVVPVVFDAADLGYISSAGLRVLLRVKKSYPEMKITNVSPEVYEILEMTGFTEILTVEKAYRIVSVEGCEEIGRGANGTIYRIDQDNVVKVYNNADALADIQHEREVARTALILGIPTAISYDVVKVGESYGSVFELLNARSFSKILGTEPEKLDWCVKEYVEMLNRIHGTLVPEGKLPDMRKTALSWAKFMQDHLPEAAAKILLALFEEIPHDDHMLHGDYHTKNLELQNDEVLLIDMDTLAVGHPIYELASMFNAFLGFYELDHEGVKSFLGFDYDLSVKFWNQVLAAYLGTDDQKTIKDVENKARVIGYTRLIRRAIRRNLQETEEGKANIEHWTKELLELLKTTDTLLFSRNVHAEAKPANELEVEAVTENLPQVLGFIEQQLERTLCPMKAQLEITLAAEEIFVNIANYAYAPEIGTAIVCVEVTEEPVEVTITFIDNGMPYDPLSKEDPDISLSAEERSIGGLGVFLVKQTMDNVTYEYKDGQNILKLKKTF